MRPRSIESINELKELGITIKTANNEWEKKQNQIRQKYQRKIEDIATALEKNPNNPILNHQKNTFEDRYQQEITDLATTKQNNDQIIYQKICSLMINPNNEIAYIEFKKEFHDALYTLDKELQQRAKALNKDTESNVLEEVKHVDVLVFNSINKLATKDILVDIDKATVALTMQLCPFTNYDLVKSSTLANEIASYVTECYNTNKKASYEMITKKIEQMLDPDLNKNLFVPLLQAIKKSCFDYIHHKEFLYTNLYNAKKLEFQQQLRGEFYEKLIDQDQARIHIEQNMLNHLIQSKNPKDFYLTMVRLAIDEMTAKRRAIEQKDTQALESFKQHQLVVFEQLRSELDTCLLNFLLINEMTDPAIRMLNISEVQQMYMKIAISGYIPQLSEDNSEYYSLTTKDILKILDEEEQKTYPSKPKDSFALPDNITNTDIQMNTEEKIKQRSILKFKFYKDHIEKDNFNEFKAVLRFEKNIDVLEQLKNELKSDPSKKSFLDIIVEQLKYVNNHYQCQRKPIFSTKIVSTENIQVHPR